MSWLSSLGNKISTAIFGGAAPKTYNSVGGVTFNPAAEAGIQYAQPTYSNGATGPQNRFDVIYEAQDRQARDAYNRQLRLMGVQADLNNYQINETVTATNDIYKTQHQSKGLFSTILDIGAGFFTGNWGAALGSAAKDYNASQGIGVPTNAYSGQGFPAGYGMSNQGSGGLFSGTVDGYSLFRPYRTGANPGFTPNFVPGNPTYNGPAAAPYQKYPAATVGDYNYNSSYFPV